MVLSPDRSRTLGGLQQGPGTSVSRILVGRSLDGVHLGGWLLGLLTLLVACCLRGLPLSILYLLFSVVAALLVLTAQPTSNTLFVDQPMTFALCAVAVFLFFATTGLRLRLAVWSMLKLAAVMALVSGVMSLGHGAAVETATARLDRVARVLALLGLLGVWAFLPVFPGVALLQRLFGMAAIVWLGLGIVIVEGPVSILSEVGARVGNRPSQNASHTMEPS
jgi:hypothetical protein